MTDKTIDYKQAGVDIDAGNQTVNAIKSHVESTFSNAVLSQLGHFAGLYDLSGITQNYYHPVLAQSTDGVGTKTMIANLCGDYSTIGVDLLSATSNDILVIGAKPLTLLDYIATSKLEPRIIEAIVAGMCVACRENGVSLIGGETAEMPGTYQAKEHDVVGTITGIVDRNNIIDGSRIQLGDKIYGFASSGLHTNGYSLARKLFFEIGGYDVKSEINGFDKPLGHTLLTPHLNYTNPVLNLLEQKAPIHGMVHITGGGLLENLPRVLPQNLSAQINKTSWLEPIVFKKLRELGNLTDSDMYQTFNMGIGYVLIGPESLGDKIKSIGKQFTLNTYEIGQVVAGPNTVELNS